MKVALVVHDFDSNFGQGRYCAEIVRRLAHQAEFHIVANTCRPEDLPPSAHFHHVPALRSKALTTVFSFILPAELAVQRLRPDLIHAQGLSCWSADLITGHMCNAARFDRTPANQTKPRRFMSWVVPWERRFFQQRRASRLISISKALDREIRQYYTWNKPSDIIYHGTNTVQFRPPENPAEKRALQSRFGLSPNRWNWIFMGEAIKGLRPALEQLPHFPDADLLVISRSQLHEYKCLAQNLGIHGRVHFHGFERSPELAFRAADLFLYPNDYDPFGMVGAEAMASGLPVIMGAEIGVSELVSNGINGLLCNPLQPNSVQAALSHLHSLPDRGASLGLHARNTILLHSWDRCAADTWNSYLATLESRRQRSS